MTEDLITKFIDVCTLPWTNITIEVVNALQVNASDHVLGQQGRPPANDLNINKQKVLSEGEKKKTQWAAVHKGNHGALPIVCLDFESRSGHPD